MAGSTRPVLGLLGDDGALLYGVPHVPAASGARIRVWLLSAARPPEAIIGVPPALPGKLRRRERGGKRVGDPLVIPSSAAWVAVAPSCTLYPTARWNDIRDWLVSAAWPQAHQRVKQSEGAVPE